MWCHMTNLYCFPTSSARWKPMLLPRYPESMARVKDLNHRNVSNSIQHTINQTVNAIVFCAGGAFGGLSIFLRIYWSFETYFISRTIMISFWPFRRRFCQSDIVTVKYINWYAAQPILSSKIDLQRLNLEASSYVPLSCENFQKFHTASLTDMYV